jgi:hypothetical protein
MRLTRPCLIALAGIASVVAPLACASEGDATPETASDAGADSSGTTPDGTLDDAGSDGGVDADAGFEPCSASGICVVPAPIDTSINLMSISGSSASDVWAVGTNRTIVHYDGSAWEKHAIVDDASPPFTMRAVWVGRSDDVWIADGLSLRHSTGWKGGATEWSAHRFYPPETLTGNGPFGVSGKGGSVWIARFGWLDFDPAATLIKCSGWGEGGGLVDPELLGASDNWDELFGTGYGTVAVTRANEAWATSAGTSVWSGARVVRVFRSDAEPPAWQREEFNSRTARHLYGIWGDDDVVWLVGEGGVTRRMTRAALATRTFEIVETPVIADLRGVFGFGADDVWAVGDESTVLHWDGKAWTKLATPFDGMRDKPRLFAVWGSSKTDLWIAGGGVVLHVVRSGS